MNEEEIKDIIEILELSKNEIKNNDENVTAILDLQDLKSLQSLLNLYNKEKDLNSELQIRYKIEHEKYLEEKARNKDLEQIEKEHKEENGRLRDRIKELEKQYKILEVEKLRYNIQYLENDISQTPDTAMVYYSMKNCLETLREEKIKLETELQELLEESEK